jgi:two-component system response regulator DegU
MQTEESVLSDRELEVLELIAHGCKNREIALALEIEEVTTRFHVGNIIRKLGAKNRTEAVCHAFRNGWIKD